MKSLINIVCAIFLLNLSPARADYSRLTDSIVGYRPLLNTPQAPDVVFYDKQGSEIALRDFRGKTVLLNLWATWCPPCIREMPGLNDLADTFKEKNFLVLTVATGRQGREDPDSFLEERGLIAVQNVHDPKQTFMSSTDLRSLPVSLLIDPDGFVQGGVIGATHWNTPAAKKAIASILN